MFTLESSPKVVHQQLKRVGRGNGSNRGKNSGKGHKGQVKRAGKMPAHFEGGRKSLVRRTPKLRGYKQAENKSLISISFGIIASAFDAKEVVSLNTLKEKQMVSQKIKTVRIFLKGKTDKKVKFDTEDKGLHLTKGVLELSSK
jgi:large subunit ribosomal protein L15